MLALTAVDVFVAKPLPAVLFFLAALRFALAGIYELSTQAAWRHLAGVSGLAVCALAAHTLFAFELESEQSRPLLPTFRRARGRIALHGERSQQVDGVLHEPGFRQTL